jgi:hypothetical protein
VTGTVFLLMTPGYSWYALLLVALVALDGRWEWLGVAAAGAAKYVAVHLDGDSSVVGTTAYALAAAAVAAGVLIRRHRAVPADAGGVPGAARRESGRVAVGNKEE